MREIKFRAWDYNNEKLIPWENIRIEKDENEVNFSVVVFDASVGDHYDDFPIMQYAGICDIDNQEVYEGDIAKTEHGLGVVSFDDGSFYIDGTHVVDFIDIWDTFKHCFMLKVIGNIHEHKHLLEGESIAPTN